MRISVESGTKESGAKESGTSDTTCERAFKFLALGVGLTDTPLSSVADGLGAPCELVASNPETARNSILGTAHRAGPLKASVRRRVLRKGTWRCAGFLSAPAEVGVGDSGEIPGRCAPDEVARRSGACGNSARAHVVEDLVGRALTGEASAFHKSLP